MVFMSSWSKQDWQVLYKSKKRICTTVISHANINESNILNASNNDNIIVTSNISHGNVQNETSFNTLINLQKVTYSESGDSIND